MSFDLFVGLFLVLAGSERWYERRFSQAAVRGQQKASWSYVLLHGFYIIILILSAVEYYWRRPLVHWPVVILGLVLFGVSLAVRLIAIQTLGRFWSLHVEIRAEHQLVREGIYRHIRHPAYLAMMLEVIAIPLVANSFYTAGFALVTFIPALLLRWRVEERELIEKLGDLYRQYRKEVGAFLPRPRWGGGSPRT